MNQCSPAFIALGEYCKNRNEQEAAGPKGEQTIVTKCSKTMLLPTKMPTITSRLDCSRRVMECTYCKMPEKLFSRKVPHARYVIEERSCTDCTFEHCSWSCSVSAFYNSPDIGSNFTSIIFVRRGTKDKWNILALMQ